MSELSVLQKSLRELKSEERKIRRKAIVSLKEIADEGAVDALLDALKDRDYFVRSYAAVILGKLKNERAVDALASALSDRSRNVSDAAFWALGEIDSERAVDALVRNAMKGWVFEYQYLPKIDAIKGTPSDQMIDLLCSMLTDEAPDQRQLAIRLLRKFKSPRAIDALNNVLEDKNIGPEAGQIIGAIGGIHATTVLIDAVEHGNGLVKFGALTGLPIALRHVDMGTKHRGLDTLCNSLQDGDRRFKNIAMEGLLAVLKNLSVEERDINFETDRTERLIHALGSALSWDRSWDCGHFPVEAAELLGRFKHRLAVELLCAALADNYVRAAAVEALGNIGDSDAIVALIPLIHDENQDVRENAIVALGKMKDSRAVEALTTTLRDREYTARDGVDLLISTLGESGSDQAVDTLCEFVEDGFDVARLGLNNWERYDPHFRNLAACALAKIGSRPAVEALVRIASNLNGSLASIRAAVEGLGEVEDDSLKELATKGVCSAHYRLEPDYVHEVIRSASRLKTDRAVDLIGDYLTSSDQFASVYEIACTLIDIDNDSAFSCLSRALSDEDDMVRHPVQAALLENKTPRTKEVLAALERDDSE